MKPTPILSIPQTYVSAVRTRILRQSHIIESGCRIWDGTVDRSGYGKLKLQHGDFKRHTGAHRAAWLAFVGDIPSGLQIDHLCRNPACVNTDHMEVVTGSVNTLRADHSNKKGRSGRPLKSGNAGYCDIHGDEDIRSRVRKDGYTARQCGLCRRDYMREYMRTYKKKAA